MRIAIVGSRDYPNRRRVTDLVSALPRTDEVISGGARGVDTWAEETARQRGMKVTVFRADWETHGLSAGFIRNRQIVDRAEIVMAFWDGESRGTAHTIKLAREAGKECIVFAR